MPATDFLVEVSGLLRILFGPIFIVLFILLAMFLVLAQQLASSKNIEEIGEAIFTYTMLAVSIALMTIGALPIAISSLSGETLSTTIYLSLLLVFVTGGLFYIYNDNQANAIKSDARKLPAMLFALSIKAVGQLSIVFSMLYLILAVSLGGTNTEGWWSIPATMLVYGSLLSIFTNIRSREALLKMANGKSKKRRK